MRRVWPWSFRLCRQIARERRLWDLGPDGEREHLYRPLDERDPKLSDALRRRFVDAWIAASGFGPDRHDEAIRLVDLRVGPDEDGEGDAFRITFGFTGSTRWLYEWDGTQQTAEEFVDEVADMEAGWVHDERRLNARTDWDA